MALSSAIGVACFLLFLAASRGLPLAWDEGDAIRRAEALERWFGMLAQVRDSEALTSTFSRPTISRDWEFTTQREGHPAAYGVVICLSNAATGGWLDPPTSYRFGAMLLFAIAITSMSFRLANDYSLVVGSAAAVSLVAMPRLFAHAQFALYDGQLVSWWVLSWCALGPARRGAPGRVALGFFLGMAMATKATGWLAPLPFVVWALLYRDRRALMALLVAAPVSLFTFFALNPPLWYGPIDGLIEFFSLNLNRGDTAGLNISTQFLGRLYNLDHPLPWYNTSVWTAVTVPVPILLFAMVGVFVTLRKAIRRPQGMLIVANMATLLIIRASPLAPPHDGVRLFLPAYAFGAMLAGIGFGIAFEWIRARLPARPKWRLLAQATIVFLLLAPLFNLYWYAPQWLSYYNVAIGGLRGATAAGMEPTYYWDALDGEVLAWLHAHTAEDEKIHFAAAPTENLARLRQWGRLKRGYRTGDPGDFRWYVLQRRPSSWSAADRHLIEHRTPAFRKTLRPPKQGFGPWRLDVHLIEVYHFEDYEQASLRAHENARRDTSADAP